ncbi:VOC family protein [bacterium]|nr:MAG: VOC family protein [bacterium]
MVLNHLTLAVPEVGETKAFLEKYFGLTDMGSRPNMAFLNDDRGMVLTLIKAKDVSYPAFFHIGFIQESETKVDEINQRLKADGIDVSPPERSHGYTFYVQAPGGFLVEVLG